jgi:hypothetical protein
MSEADFFCPAPASMASYQTRMNAVLRQYYQAHRETTRRTGRPV